MNAWEGLDPIGVVSGLLRASQQLGSFLDSIVSDKLELTLAQFQVLRLINSNPAVQPSQLSEAIGCTRGNITGIVNRLQRDGLVERRHSETDRRVVHLFVTDRGQRLAAEEPGVRQACIAIVEQLSRAERTSVVEALAILRAGNRAMEASGPGDEVAVTTEATATVAPAAKTKSGAKEHRQRSPQPARKKEPAPDAATRKLTPQKQQGVVVVPRRSRRIRVVRDAREPDKP